MDDSALDYAVAQLWAQALHYGELAVYGLFIILFVVACGSIGRTTDPPKPAEKPPTPEAAPEENEAPK
jgi:hypothetical protein